MKIETIITDLDGTLLNSNNEISIKTKEALLEAQRKGLRLVLASGRSTNAIFPYALELELDKYNGLILSYNGACVVDCKTKKILYSRTIDKKIAADLLKHLNDFDVSIIVNDDRHVYVHDAYSGIVELDGYFGDGLQSYNVIEGEARSGNYLIHEVNNLSEFVDFPLNKILVAANSSYFDEHKNKLIEPFKDNTTALFSSPFFLEFTHPDVDKGTTIINELPKFGINPQTTIAFGDGMNDFSMLQNVKIGIAMENAIPELLKIATFSTSSNDSNGIVHALLKLQVI